MEETLKSQLVDIVRDTQIQLFWAYKNSRKEEAAAADPRSGELTGVADNATQQQPTPASTTNPGSATPSASVTVPASTVAAATTAMPGQSSIDEELEAFHPEPYFGGEFDEFDGLLFDLSGETSCEEWHDSGYDTMAWPSEREGSPSKSGAEML